MPKILHRKKLRKYCWRRFNIIVYLPRLGFKSRPLDFIPEFRHNGAQQRDERSKYKIFTFQPKTIQCTVWQSILPRCAFIAYWLKYLQEEIFRRAVVCR